MIQRFDIVDLRQRFERSFLPEPNSGCWLWDGTCDSRGYGVLSLARRRILKAHRLAWRLYRNRDPAGLFVCHRCDTPACVNPDHLFLGTHLDNMSDRDAKGRTASCGASGDRNGTKTKPEATHRGAQIVQAKLNDDQVRAIRADRRRLQEIASDYGMSQAAISLVRNRKTWRHVD